MSAKPAIALLNIGSAIMTGMGFYSFLLPWAERLVGGSGWMLAATVAGGLSLAVQRLVYTFWWQVGTESALRPPTNLLAALAASALSWGGAAGGFVMMVSHLDLLAERERSEAEATAVPLRSFAADFADLRAGLTQMAAQSQRLARDETEGRPTCTNDQSTGAACGPRCRLRQRHAEVIAAQEAAAAALEAEARQLALDMASAQGAAAQGDVYERALALQANTDQAAIAAELEALAAEFGVPLTDPGTSGRTFICEDAQTAERLRALSAKVAARVALPDLPPRAQRVDMSDTIGCVASRLGELVGLSQRCAGAPADGPMLMALVLEGAVVLFILAEVGRLRRRGTIPTRPEAIGAALGAAPSAYLMLHADWLVRAASLFVIDAPPEGRLIAVPVDGSGTARAEADRLVRLLGLRAPAYVNVPLAETDPDWVAARADDLGDAVAFNLYPWPAEADALIERAQHVRNREVRRAG